MDVHSDTDAMSGCWEIFRSVFQDLSKSNNGLVSYDKLSSLLTKKKNWVICDCEFSIGYRNII